MMATSSRRRLRLLSTKVIAIVLMTVASNGYASDTVNTTFKAVYVDKANNIHLVFHDGRDKKISSSGNAASATLAPDKNSAAWLVLHAWIAPGAAGPGASQLALYTHGQLRHIKCEPFIRDYWFWMGGRQIAIDCGGRHFAGTLILHDVETLRPVDSIVQADVPEEQRPAWSRPDSDKAVAVPP
jgi:hypothetical protein